MSGHGIPGQTPYIQWMNRIFRERLSVRRSSAILASAALATVVLAGLGLPASAQILIPNGNAQIQQNDLRALQNRVQRQQFQQQQQQYRDQDRVIVQPPPVVPRVKPNCQTQIIGSTAVNTCH